MRSRTWILPSLVFSGLATLVACSSGHDTESAAATQSASTSPIAMPRWATPSHYAGPVEASAPIRLQVHLRLRNQSDAQTELAAISNPDDARYGQFVSDADFAAKYAPTDEDVSVVKKYLESFGLRVIEEPSNRAYLTAVGMSASAGDAFGTHLGLYHVGTDLKRAPMTAPTLPASVQSRVSAVLGLSQPAQMKSRVMKSHAIFRNALAKRIHPSDTVPASTCSQYYGQILDTEDPAFGTFPSPFPYATCGFTPPQLRQAYGFEKSIRAGNDGHGQTIAIVDAWTPPTLLADATTYAAHQDADYPMAKGQLTILQGPGTPQDPDTGWYGESTLDVEAEHAIAPGAKIVYVGAQSADDQDLIAAINLIVSKKLASAISNSWDGLEAGTTDYTAFQAIAIQAGLKGIGLYFASGDSGDEAPNNPIEPGVPTVDFPASLAEVTAVGGTSLALGNSGQRVFELAWQTAVSFLELPDGGFPANNSSPDGGYIWAPAPPGDWYFGTGGGTSTVYLQPTWQKGIVPAAIANAPGAPSRAIPDVAMLADPMTGFLIGGTFDSGYSESAIGGTSLATPLFTAAIALAQQYAGRHFGSANALIYKASKKGAFTDIAPSKTPEAVAVPGGIITTFDYSGPENTNGSATGYDTATGLGVPNGTKFFSAMKAAN